MIIDYSNEIFNEVAVRLRSIFSRLRVVGEYVQTPTSFPCVAMDETQNVPTHLDSAVENKYARVQYRVQVFSNLENGKRAEARKIYAEVDSIMQAMGLICKTYTTTPAVYNAEIYSITATYEGVIDRAGVVYRG